MVQNPKLSIIEPPKAIGGTTVVSKTIRQQKRTAAYTWAAAIGMGIPYALKIVGDVAPQIAALFPRHTALVLDICGLAGAIGIAALAHQRTGSVADIKRVNFTPTGAELV